ncbi:hypothetical protein [Maribacter sp. 2307UL18-2]|uniref:hypothetical protein n=1 Tax=Maribacter sp. 2307UL18-2 TaxID=3386274 RepID=UPI0039BC8EB9
MKKKRVKVFSMNSRHFVNIYDTFIGKRITISLLYRSILRGTAVLMIDYIRIIFGIHFEAYLVLKVVSWVKRIKERPQLIHFLL